MRAILVVGLAVLAGCTGDGGDEGSFVGGSFQFTTYGVEDLCYDGAFEVIFMPEGTPNDFANPIDLPSWEDLPTTYTISLQEPFTDMEVTVEPGESEDEMIVRGAQQRGIELDADTYPGCLVDIDIDVDLTILSADEVSATAYLNTASFDEDGCPVVQSDPCDIILDLKATRL